MRNRSIMIAFFLFMITGTAFSQDYREIRVDYAHSMRIPYQEIRIRIASAGKSGFVMYVNTKRMEGASGFEDSNRSFTVPVDAAYFERLYKEIAAIDPREFIALNEGLIGCDGVSIAITIGGFQNNYSIRVWSPDLDAARRGTKPINDIVLDVFAKAGLAEWL